MLAGGRVRLESLVIDLEADLARFDSTKAWMRRQETA
jgi:hypothetical protein